MRLALTDVLYRRQNGLCFMCGFVLDRDLPQGHTMSMAKYYRPQSETEQPTQALCHRRCLDTLAIRMPQNNEPAYHPDIQTGPPITITTLSQLHAAYYDDMDGHVRYSAGYMIKRGFLEKP